MKGDLLMAHLFATLPDSMAARHALLRDAADCIPAKNPRREELVRLAIQLDEHERAVRSVQASFPFLSGITSNNRNGTK